MIGEQVDRVASKLRSPAGQRFRKCIEEHGATPPPIPTEQQVKHIQKHGFAGDLSNGGDLRSPGQRNPYGLNKQQLKQLKASQSDPEGLQKAREACAELAPSGLMAK